MFARLFFIFLSFLLRNVFAFSINLLEASRTRPSGAEKKKCVVWPSSFGEGGVREGSPIDYRHVLREQTYATRAR